MCKHRADYSVRNRHCKNIESLFDSASGQGGTLAAERCLFFVCEKNLEEPNCLNSCLENPFFEHQNFEKKNNHILMNYISTTCHFLEKNMSFERQTVLSKIKYSQFDPTTSFIDGLHPILENTFRDNPTLNKGQCSTFS